MGVEVKVKIFVFPFNPLLFLWEGVNATNISLQTLKSLSKEKNIGCKTFSFHPWYSGIDKPNFHSRKPDGLKRM